MEIKPYQSENENVEEVLNFYIGLFNEIIEEICRYKDYKDIEVDDNCKEYVEL